MCAECVSSLRLLRKNTREKSDKSPTFRRKGHKQEGCEEVRPDPQEIFSLWINRTLPDTETISQRPSSQTL
jgi:hypothetical protein